MWAKTASPNCELVYDCLSPTTPTRTFGLLPSPSTGRPSASAPKISSPLATWRRPTDQAASPKSAFRSKPDNISEAREAQASGAKAIAFANGGGDTIRSITQAREFGLVDEKRKIAAFILHVTDVHALGLAAAQGTLVMDAFYWDINDETKAWSQRFMARNNGRPPTAVQAGAYSAVLHYLKAIQAAGTKDAEKVAAKMKELKINDALMKDSYIREDGRVVREYYLLEVKKPSDSKYPWDYFKVVAVVPGSEVTRPLSEGGCPLVASK